jgi:hypothetical protein
MVGGTERGREAFDRQAWAEACAQLSAADGELTLEPDDLERLAVATYLVGRDDDSVDAWNRGPPSGEPRSALASVFVGYEMLYVTLVEPTVPWKPSITM